MTLDSGRVTHAHGCVTHVNPAWFATGGRGCVWW